MAGFDDEARAAKFYGQVDGDDHAPDSATALTGKAPTPKKVERSDDDFKSSLYADVNIDRGDLTDFGDLDPGIGRRDRTPQRSGDDDDETGRARKLYDKPDAPQKPQAVKNADGEQRKAKDDAQSGNGETDADDFWPADYEMDQQALADFHGSVHGIDTQTEDGRSKLLEMHVEARKREIAATIKEGSDAIEAWADDARSDPELSSGFDGKVKQAQEVLKQYATPEFNHLLANTGLGNHPEVIRIFSRIAKDIRHLLSKV